MFILKIKNNNNIVFLIMLCLTMILNCQNTKIESESIDYLNKKYPGSVSKDKINNNYEVIVDFSTEKNIIESDLNYLKKIENITVFRMSNIKITNSSIESLKTLKKLQVISLENVNLTDYGLQLICKNHPNLERLILNNTPITSEGLKYIGELKKLNYLELRATKIDDEALGYLSQLDNLVNLSLSNTRITNQALPNLMKFKKMGSLVIVYTQITEEGANILTDYYKKNNPSTTVYWDPETAP